MRKNNAGINAVVVLLIKAKNVAINDLYGLIYPAKEKFSATTTMVVQSPVSDKNPFKIKSSAANRSREIKNLLSTEILPGSKFFLFAAILCLYLD